MKPTAWPASDSRWAGLLTGHEDLVKASENWPVAPNTPAGVTRILEVSRELFCHSWFVYDFLMVAAVQSLIGVEAALRDRLKERPRRGGPTMWNLVEQALSRGLIARERAEHVLTAVELRNSWLHVGGQKVVSPAMAERVVAESHALVADLYAARARGTSEELD